MWEDPIVKETRDNRDALFAQFDYDLRALFLHLKEEERKSGRTYKSYPPKPAKPRAVTGSS